MVFPIIRTFKLESSLGNEPSSENGRLKSSLSNIFKLFLFFASLSELLVDWNLKYIPYQTHVTSQPLRLRSLFHQSFYSFYKCLNTKIDLKNNAVVKWTRNRWPVKKHFYNCKLYFCRFFEFLLAQNLCLYKKQNKNILFNDKDYSLAIQIYFFIR